VQQVVAFEHGKNCFRTNQDFHERGLNKNKKRSGYSDARLDNLAFNFGKLILNECFKIISNF